MQLENNRIFLRPWKKTDAQSLYEITKSNLFEKSTGFKKVIQWKTVLMK